MSSSFFDTPETTPGAVALVDDDPHIAHALALWLQTLGHACSLHTTADSLLGSLQLRQGQVWVPVEGLPQTGSQEGVHMAPLVAAVMDLTLPDRSGFELARQLQALGLRGPLVVITAATGEELSGYGPLPQSVQCLRKPFRLDELEQALQLR